MGAWEVETMQLRSVSALILLIAGLALVAFEISIYGPAPAEAAPQAQPQPRPQAEPANRVPPRTSPAHPVPRYGTMMRDVSGCVSGVRGNCARKKSRKARERGRPFVSYFATRSKNASTRKASESLSPPKPVFCVSAFLDVLQERPNLFVDGTRERRIRRPLVVQTGSERAKHFRKRRERFNCTRIVQRGCLHGCFQDRVRKSRNQRPALVNEIRRNREFWIGHFTRRNRLAVLALPSPRSDEMRAVGGAINGHLPFFAATDRANHLALGGTIALRFSRLT